MSFTSAPLPGSRPTTMSGNMMLMAAMMTWAASFPAADVLLKGGWDPLFLINIRYVVALAILVPLWIYADGLRSVIHAKWGKAIWIGGIAFGVGAYLLIVAQALTEPVIVAIIASAMPVAATVIEVIHRQRRLTRTFAFGLCATVAGGVIAAGATPAPNLGWGVLAASVATIVFAWGSNATVKELPNMSTMGRTTVTFSGAAIVMTVIAMAASGMGYAVIPETIVSPQNAAMLGIYAIFGLVISQNLWLAGVSKLGIALASFHINTAPFYVMIFMCALGAGWSWPQAIGAAVVGMGVLVAQRG